MEQAAAPRLARAIRIAGLVLAIALAYSGTFAAPFIFDDQVNIVENASIRTWEPLAGVLFPPPGSGLVGRPLVNFTLALNHAISGLNPWSYHALNLMIHLGSALCLWGLIRELLAQDRGPAGLSDASKTWVAWGSALVWALHPLQTQAVTYVIQRCESLMGLFFLATLYAYVRSWTARNPRLWQGLAVGAFLACLGCKEVGVMLLPTLLALDWTFRGLAPARVFRHAPVLYGGLLAALALLGLATLLGTGYSTYSGHLLPSRWNYIAAQGQILLRYLRLVLWPSDLTLDYGWRVGALRETWPAAVAAAMLLGVSLWLLFRRRPAGFLGVACFAVLAPTSLVPLPDAIFEHRMYLPSAALVTLAVFGLATWLQRQPGRSPKALVAGILAMALPLGARTYVRNQDYASTLTIWADTQRKRPENFRAYHGLAGALTERGDLQGSLVLLKKAAALNPTSFSVRNDLGITLIKLQRPAEAIPELAEAVRLSPANPKARNNLGAAFLMTDHLEEAIQEFRKAIALDPAYVSPRRNLESALAQKQAR